GNAPLGKTVLELLKEDIANDTDLTGWVKAGYVENASKELLSINKISKQEHDKWRISANLSPSP
ncbi:unnamed protein product, partial [marine sediment metagenome]